MKSWHPLCCPLTILCILMEIGSSSRILPLLTRRVVEHHLRQTMACFITGLESDGLFDLGDLGSKGQRVSSSQFGVVEAKIGQRVGQFTNAIDAWRLRLGYVVKKHGGGLE